ncbi:hypothetical protein C8J57DRAFT_1673451 [Mycena rebaudengoi]|nr:hypothetical protein C8J57DRAFT_1673451 [Mycena rebaudengoi]
MADDSHSTRIELLNEDNWMPTKRRILALLRDKDLDESHSSHIIALIVVAIHDLKRDLKTHSKLDVEKILTPSTRIKTTSNTCPAPPARRGPVEKLFAGVELRGAPSVRIEGTWAVKLECAVWQTCYFELEGGEEEDSHCLVELVPAPPGASWADTARANTARGVGKRCIASRASFAPQPLHLLCDVHPHVKVVPGRWTRISDMTTQIHDLTFLTTRTIQRMIQAENRQLWEVISSEKHQKPEELLPASKHSETQGAHPVQLRGQKNVRVHSSKVRTHPFASLGTQEQVLSYPHPVGKSFNKRRITLREGGAHARSRLHGRQRNKGDGEDVTGEVHLSYEMGISPLAAKGSWHNALKGIIVVMMAEDYPSATLSGQSRCVTKPSKSIYDTTSLLRLTPGRD